MFRSAQTIGRLMMSTPHFDTHVRGQKIDQMMKSTSNHPCNRKALRPRLLTPSLRKGVAEVRDIAQLCNASQIMDRDTCNRSGRFESTSLFYKI